MLFVLMLLSSVFLFIVAPVMAIKKYYSPAHYTIPMNFFWILFTVLSWPFIPMILAGRKHDTLIMRIFWLSIVIWCVSIGYWLVTNPDQLMNIQQKYMMQV